MGHAVEIRFWECGDPPPHITAALCFFFNFLKYHVEGLKTNTKEPLRKISSERFLNSLKDWTKNNCKSEKVSEKV